MTAAPPPRPAWRAAWLALHRYAGLAMAAFLIVTGFTGALLAFYPELEATFAPYAFRVAPRGTPLPLDELVARVERALPAIAVEGVNAPQRPDESARVLVRPRGQADAPDAPPYTEVFADPYDGRVLAKRRWGEARLDSLHVMAFLYSLHMSLHLPGRIGTILLGIVAVAWMLDCFVGAYLTLPPRRRPRRAPPAWWRRFRPAWGVKRTTSRPRLYLDLHRAGGLWLWLVLFVLAMSSVALNLADEVFRPAVRLVGTLSPDVFSVLVERKSTRPPALGYDAAVARAREHVPPGEAGEALLGYASYLADNRVYWLAFAPRDRANRLAALDFAWVFLDADDGSLVALRSYARGTAADKFMDMQFPLHSGQVLGLPGRILVCIGGIVTVTLSLTGVYLWWKKRRARELQHARRERAPAPSTGVSGD